MKGKNQFEKHHPRIRREAVLKSLAWGLSAGFAATFIAAAITWFSPLRTPIIPIVTLLTVSIVVSVLLYLVKFRPSALNSARRLDTMGLDERAVTMIELLNDDSEIAKLQREDTKAALEKLDQKNIRCKFSSKLIACLVISAFLGCFMTALTFSGSSGQEWLDSILPEEMEVFVSVTYLVEEGGSIEGETDQLIPLGTNSAPVLAVAEDGYVFIGWDDGEPYPSRTEKNVNKDIVVMAIFELIEGEEPEDDEEGDEGDEGGEDEAGEPEEESNDSESQKPDTQQPEDNNAEEKEGGGKYDDFNQIIDGKTYYRDYLESYRADIEKFLKEHGDQLTEKQKAIILAYIGIV